MQQTDQKASGRSRTVVPVIMLAVVLAVAAFLCIHLAGSRRDLRRQAADITASAESTDAVRAEVTADKENVWYAMREDEQKAADELKARIDDNNGSASRTRSQVEVVLNSKTRAGKAGLSATLLESAAAFLEARAVSGEGSAEAGD